MSELTDRLRRIAGSEPKVIWQPEPELLLHPNIPKPLHGVAPKVVLGASWWNEERLRAYESTDYHCKACGVHKQFAKYRHWLEAHERYEIDYVRGRMKYLGAVPLCHFCHNFVHDGRLQALLEHGKVHHAKYAAIMQHGEEVLREAGLVRKSREDREQEMAQLLTNGLVAKWGKWRLVIGRKTYKPLYETQEQWQLAMAKKMLGTDLED